jgi:predicted transcriptional regulator
MVLNLIENTDLDAEEVDQLRRLISRKAKGQQK